MEDLQAFTKELSGMLLSIDDKLKYELSVLEKKCMEPNDIEKFVTCMHSNVEKIDKESKNLEFRMSFVQNKTQECMRKGIEGKTDLEICKQQTRNEVANYIDKFLFNIRK